MSSICLCLFKFHSSKPCSFYCIDLLLPWLNLFLGIVFNAVVNERVFFISFSDVSLLMYRNVTGFYILIFVSCNLLKSLIGSNSFLVEPLGFSIYKIISVISSANSDSFASCFLIWMPFIALLAPNSSPGI